MNKVDIPVIHATHAQNPIDECGGVATFRVSNLIPQIEFNPADISFQTPFPQTEIVEKIVPFSPSDTSLFPSIGSTFLGFQILEELGRGAFGRVYLAKQGDLGERLVALKVAKDIFDESQTLAQFQHSHIVPIYSFHSQGALQAVCMPYLGRMTLADVLVRMNGKRKLPHSGRELKSTLNQNAMETLPLHQASSKTQPSHNPVTIRNEIQSPAQDGWERLEGLSFVEAVLTLGGQLTEGLSHAHQRGILHKDLKPANVLLTDDGRPMLLDFNLAEDTKQRTMTDRAAAGGTLPYMAPEQLRHFIDRKGSLDVRCDIFSLGVILFELLTGRHPFPIRRGKIKDAAEEMYQDRISKPPSLRSVNPEISNSVEAIIWKCLSPNLDERYQKAADLREDIERQLNHRPLKFAKNTSRKEVIAKWIHRHPQLTSSTSISLIAAMLLVAVIGTSWTSFDRVRQFESQAHFQKHRKLFADTQLFLDDRHQSGLLPEDSVSKLENVLNHYGILDNPKWFDSDPVNRLPAVDRNQLRIDIGEVYFRLAETSYLKALGSNQLSHQKSWIQQSENWNLQAKELAGQDIPGAIDSLKDSLSSLREKLPNQDSQPQPATTPRDLALVGGHLAKAGRHREAIAVLRQATQIDPKDFSAWFVRGTSHLALEQNELAAMCFGACLAIREDFAPAWRNRGFAFGRLRFFDQAIDDYSRAIKINPHDAESYLQRAFVKESCGDAKGAEGDYSTCIELAQPSLRTYFLRAEIRKQRGDIAGAKADREKGLLLIPQDDVSWMMRAESQLESNPKAALGDVEEGLKINPFSLTGLQLKAHILGERLHQDREAIEVLNRAVELFPDSAAVRAGRGVHLARIGNRTAAIVDAKDAELLDSKAPNLYQIGCIYALTCRSHPEDKAEALRLLWAGLKMGFGIDIAENDTDLDSLRNDNEFKRILIKAKSLHSLKHDK